MGLRPTQGNEKRIGPATTLYGTATLSFVILRACDFFDLFVFLAPDQMFFSPLQKSVILRVCDFIGFAKKSTLKTKRLGASKGAKNQKVQP